MFYLPTLSDSYGEHLTITRNVIERVLLLTLTLKLILRMIQTVRVKFTAAAP